MPGHKLRAVLDTSVLVAGVLRPDGPSGQVPRAFRRGLFTHVTSSAILDEMADVLAREKIQRVTQLSRQDIASLHVAMQQRAESASGEYQDVDLVDSDPKDKPIVAAALEMQAQYVVTLDAADLLRLKGLPGVCPSAGTNRVSDGISAPAGTLIAAKRTIQCAATRTSRWRRNCWSTERFECWTESKTCRRPGNSLTTSRLSSGGQPVKPAGSPRAPASSVATNGDEVLVLTSNVRRQPRRLPSSASPSPSGTTSISPKR